MIALTCYYLSTKAATFSTKPAKSLCVHPQVCKAKKFLWERRWNLAVPHKASCCRREEPNRGMVSDHIAGGLPPRARPSQGYQC